jgi:hypothetical protein
MLALTPEERLRQNDRTLAMIHELREGLVRKLELIVELKRASDQ